MKFEPLSHPVWRYRTEELRTLLSTPLSTAELIREARRYLHRSDDFTRQALAAADGTGVEFVGGSWRRLGEPSGRDRSEGGGRLEIDRARLEARA